MNPLAKLSQATTALAEARTLEEIKAIRDMAEQARLYAQANKLGLDAINAGTEIRLRADRKMGEVLILAKETGEIREGRPGKRLEEQTVSLSDIGIGKFQSHVTQQLARLPEQVFEARIEATKARATAHPPRSAQAPARPTRRQQRVSHCQSQPWLGYPAGPARHPYGPAMP